MAYALVASGSSLYVFYPDGTSQALTLPTGYTIGARRLRGAVLGRDIVGVYAPSAPVWVDANNTVRGLILQAPALKPTTAVGAAGSLSGTYAGIKYSFVIKDAETGDVLAESGLSPAGDSVTVSSQLIALSNIMASANTAVNCRRFYRPTTGGSVLYEWFDLDDNTTTGLSMEGADESLPTTPVSSELGSPPAQLELIAEWKGRLWAKSPADPDRLYGTAEKKIYAWPLEFPVGPAGHDTYGITGFLPRRDEFGIGRRDSLWKLTGTDADDFRIVRIAEGVGILAPDTCLVVRDVGYFLGVQFDQIGVYEWSGSGVQCISEEKVHPWFNTDTYLARGELKNAFAGYNPATDSIEVFAAAVGGTTINRWASFDLKKREWLGLHRTSTFNPTCRANLLDTNEVGTVVVGGSDGKLYARQSTRTDGTATGIAMDVLTRMHFGEPAAPDIEHYFGELSVVSKIEAAGTLTITPYVGGLDASAGTALSHTLTTGRQRLGRLGTGRGAQLNFTESTAGQDVELYGYEISPWHELGRR